jgi:prepilin-type N-terminal cleavage/methylation domain-containing protein
MANGTLHDEAGFSLIEVVVCVAVLTFGCVAALGAFPPLVRNADAGLMRAAATSIARNAIERVRAAVAYYPPGSALDPAARARTTADHAWALVRSSTYDTVARFERSFCGSAALTTDVPMTVTTSYDATSDTVAVSVQYPPSPCVPSAHTTVTLSALLAPSAYAPQTVLPQTVADPERQ